MAPETLQGTPKDDFGSHRCDPPPCSTSQQCYPKAYNRVPVPYVNEPRGKWEWNSKTHKSAHQIPEDSNGIFRLYLTLY